MAVGQEEASRCPRKAVLATSDAQRQIVLEPTAFRMCEYSLVFSFIFHQVLAHYDIMTVSTITEIYSCKPFIWGALKEQFTQT